jgi:hypothetical protein
MRSEIAFSGRPAFYRRADRSRPRESMSACRRAVLMSAAVHRAAASSRVIPAPFLQKDGGDERWLLDGGSRRDDGGGGQSVVWSFGSIPHAELMRSLARRIVDRRVLHLIKVWLECTVEETDDRGRKTRTTEAKDSGRGIPQGSPITPLTQKVISRFERVVTGWRATPVLDWRLKK